MRFNTPNLLRATLLASLSMALVFLSHPVHAQQAESAPSRAKIGIMSHSDFVPDRVKPQQGQLIGLPDVLAGRIIEHLSNSRRFDLVDRTALRRVVLEQRFGKNIQKTYLDQTLDKAISSMESVHGGWVAVPPDSASPVGRARAGAGTVGTTGTLADYNDLIKDFQDLGSALGADFMVLGKLEKIERSSKSTAVPYSTSGRSVQANLVDARLQLRVIEVGTGTLAGATSIRTQLSETLFEGEVSDSDQFTFYDHLGQLAAAKILDITFPARIVNLDPMVISRGANDGVNEGDIYLIEREGKELTDANGLIIARLKSKIGQVTVASVQDTVAVVQPLKGEGFMQGDLAGLDTESVTPITTVASQATQQIGAQKQTIANSKQLPRVALGLVKSDSTARTAPQAHAHVTQFTDTIISRLTQTRRFQMIDRQEVDQLLTEQQAQALAENRDMPSAMGTLKGADYLVYGSLASFDIQESTVQLPNSSHSFKQVIGRVEGNMRVVDARSGDILESRKVSATQSLEPGASPKLLDTLLADAYAEQVVLLMMNAIYPIKVAHVGADGAVYINRGNDGGLYVGEILEALRPGRPVIDPDTGIQLGAEETPTGQVTVTEVEDARSKGELAVGSRVARGDLLKRNVQNRGKRASLAARQQQSAPKRSGGALAGGQKASQAQAKAGIAVGLIKVTPGAITSRLTPGAVKQLTDEFILKLHNSNRFVVMERQEVDQILDEKAFEAISAGGDIQERLRELKGADYLIHGEIVNFYTRTTQKKVPYMDEIQTTSTGLLEGVFRIIDVHTGAVTASSKTLINQTYKGTDDLNLVFNDLRDRFTTDSVAEMVSRLYPIKVLGIAADGTVYLNRGEDAGLQRGAIFDVMRPGKVLIDPDTSRSFGSSETRIAKLKVIAVEANRSRAQLTGGMGTQPGDILRTPQEVEKAPEPEMVQPAW
ncbi:MAG: hypothetical protein GY792_28665 [Gammaproteobacteria bacterium]|nr:hypothetical protein [Gammaproteobacteria bacterium]